jgi:hypothetical protein
MELDGAGLEVCFAHTHRWHADFSLMCDHGLDTLHKMEEAAMQAAMDTWSRATLASVPEVGNHSAAFFSGNIRQPKIYQD